MKWKFWKSEEEHSPDTAENREYIAEALEARILYSGAPMDAEMPAADTEVVADAENSQHTFESLESFGANSGSIAPPEQQDGQSGTAQSELVTLTSLDNLTADEIEELARISADYWKNADLDENRQDALQALESAVLDIVSLAEPSAFILEIDASESGIFVDFPESTTILPGQSDQLGVELITDLLREVGEPEVLERLAAEQIAARTVEVPVEQQPLTLSTLDFIAEAAEQAWINSGLTADQVAALDRIEYQIVELEGAHLGYAEGSSIYIDDDAAERSWYLDETPYDLSETGFEGIDLLSVLIHEQGHVLGLEDIYQSTSNSVMYGFFGEGERRIAGDGEADGAVAGSLEGAHYAHTGLNQVTIADQAAWNAAVGTMSTNDEIVFNGAGGPINISGTVSVGAIHFQSGVYTLNGGTLNIEDSIHADANATIGSTVNIGTGGLTVTGPADVTIDGVVQDLDYQAAVQADNPISYWTFDEANSGTAAANDTGSGGSSDDGAFTGTATRTAGLRGTGAAQFNDTANDGVNVGNGADFSAATFTGGITIETLFTTDYDGNGHEEFFRKEDGGNRILLSFQSTIGANGGISFGINAGGYNELDIPLDGAGGRPTLASIADGNEHHLAATYDPVTGNREVYLDGVLIGSDNRGAGTPLSTTGSGGANAIIGNLASGSEPFGGTIDEMAIYNRALSQAEIQTHIGGAAGDLTKTGNGTLTLNGANTFTGEATVTGGTVVVGSADALGTTSGETAVNAGGTLQLDGGVTLAAETVTLNDTATLLSQSGNNTMTGNLVLAGPGTPEIQVAAGQLEVDGNVSGTGFQKTGAGDLVIDGAVAVRTIDAQSGGTDINGTTDIGAGLTVTGPADVTIDGVVQDGTGDFASLVAADGAVALWSLNETSGTTAVNGGSAGAALNGTHVNSPTLGAADVNGDGDAGTDFDGQQSALGDHIAVSGLDSVAGGNPFENDWTIEAWFVRDTQKTWSAIASNNFNNAAADDGTRGPIMTMRNNTHQLGFMAAGATETGVYVDLGAASLGQPVYAVITKTGGNTQGNATITVHANVNGVWLTSATGSNARDIQANDGFYIGRHYTSGTQMHNGVIDEVAVYDRALSLEEVQAHYAGLGGLTKSGDGTLTLNGANTFTGEATVTGGTVVVGNADALGATSGETTVESGATLAVSGGVTVAAETITLEGAATVENVSGNNTLTGTVTTVSDGSGSATLLATAGTLELDGAVNLANTLTIDGAGDVTIDGVVQDNGGGTPYQSAVRADEPISYWTFDEANSGTATASDTGSGGSSDDATFEGTATRTDGLGGTTGAALFTDTAGERVNAGTGSDFSSAAFDGGMTIETLFTSDYDGSGFEQFIRKEDGNNRILLSFQPAANMEGYNGGTVVGTGTNPGIAFGINVGGTYTELDIKFDGQDGRPTLAQVTDGNEHHLAATYDPVTGARAVYLDGVLIGSDNRGVGNAIVSGGGQIAAIGNTSGGGPDPFGGVLDEFAIYGKALTAAQIQAHINAERNLVMDGDGTLTLTAANTYSGETTVNTGTLAATNADALGSTGEGTTVNAGATLQIDGGVTLAAETVTLNDTATLLSQSGANTVSGSLVLNGPGTPEIQVAAGQLEADGSVSGIGFQKTGAGDLVIDGAVALSAIDAQAGWTDINGTVDIGGGLTVTGPADVTIDGVVQDGVVREGTGAYAQLATNDGAVALWSLKETSGTTAVNSGTAGATLNGAHVNSPTLGAADVNGDGDGAIDFDGQQNASGDHIAVSGFDSVTGGNPFENDWTIEAWFVRDSQNRWSAIASNNYDNAAADNGRQGPIMTMRDNTHQLGFMAAGVSADGVYVDLGAASLGKPVYAVITKTGGNTTGNATITVHANVDGVWLTSATGTNARDIRANDGFSIGSHYSGGNHLHDGVIDEVAIYDRALSLEEIQAHYAGTGGLTKSGDGILTLNGTNTFTGDTTVSGGTVVAGNADALGATSGETTVGTGATLALPGGVTLAAETITLDDTGKLENVSGTNTVTGTLVSTGGNPSVVQSTAGTLNLDGPVTMVGALTFDGSGDTVVDGMISDSGAVGLPAANLSGQGAGGNLDLLESGGSLVAGNIASQSAGAVAFAHDVHSAVAHTIAGVNDEIYGNNNSWLGATDNGFVGVKFAAANSIDAIAWGRSNTDSHNDRDLGTYTLQYTTDAALDTANPGAVTWQTIDSVTYTGSYPDGTPHLRHLWGFDAVHNVTGVRIVTDSISDAFPLAIDELEVHPAVFPELTKTGNGTLTLNGTSTYTGDTTVSGGTLDGTGTVGGNLTVDASGTLDPGESGIGTLTVNGDATINGNLATQIGSGAANTDLLSVGGTLDVANATLQGSGTGDQDEYVIASYDSASTDPTAFNVVTAPAGYVVEFDAANDQVKLVQTADPGCTSGHGTAHELFLLDFESAAGSTIFTSGGGSPSSINTTVATLGATNNADANATNNVWGMNTEFSTARADFSTINGGAAVTALNALPPGEYQLMLEYDQSITNDNTKVGYFLRGTNGHAAEPDTTRGGTDRWLVHNAGHSGPGNQVVDVDGDGAFSHITIAHEINGSSANSRTPSILKIVAAGDPLTGAHVFQQGRFTEIGLDIWNTASGGAPAAEAYYDNIKLSAIEIPASVTTDPLVNLTFDSGSSTTVVDATTRNGSFESGVGGWAPTQGLNIASGTSDPPGSTDGSRHAVVSITDEADGRGRVDLRARNTLSEANGDVFTINFDVQAPETGGFDRILVQPLTMNANTAVEHSGTSAIFNLTADGQYHSFTHSFDFTTTGWNGLDLRFEFLKDGADRGTGTYTATLDNVVVTQSGGSLANTGSLGGNATSTGAVSFAASSPDANSAGLAAQFDDTTGEVITYSIPANTITAESDWTVSASVFIDGDQTTFDRILEPFFVLDDAAADGTAGIRVGIPSDGVHSGQTLTTTPPLSPGWHNLTLTFDYDGSPTEGRGQTRFYLDGELYSANANALRPNFSGGLDLTLGAQPAGTRPMNGLVDDVQFFCHIVLPEAVDEGIAPEFKQTTVYVNDDWTRQNDIVNADGDIETAAVETATWGSNAFGNLADAIAALDTTQPVTIVINAGDYSAETLDLSGLSNNVTVKIVEDANDPDGDTATVSVDSLNAGSNVSIELGGGVDGVHNVATTLQVGKTAIAVTNPSFEVDDADDGDVLANRHTGWTRSGTTGTEDPAAGDFNFIPDGDQIAEVVGTGHIRQTVDHVLTEGKTYELLVDVGDPSGADFGGYNIQLYAGGVAVASETAPAGGTGAAGDGNWQTVKLTYTVPAGHAQAGLPLEIRLGGATGTESHFDNVKMFVISSTDSNFDGVISGIGGNLIKEGTGELTLTGQNTFTGETVLDGGTLNLSATGGNTLAATSTLSVGDSTTGTANDTTLNINSNQTLASLNYHLESATHNGNTTHDTILASGVTVTTGGFVNGLVANVTGDEVLTTTGGTVSGTVNIKGASAGDGALIVNGGSTDLSIGISDPPYQGNAGTRNYTLDMTGLGSFAATTTGNVYAFVGWRDDVDWKMADTSNTITAATFSHTSWGAHSQIELGGDTTLNITDINIGSEVVPGHQGSSNGGQQTISFRGDLTGTPELTIRDTAGTGRADLHIGLGGDSNGLITSTVDLTGGTIDALLNELVIGEGHTRTDTNGNDGSGTLTFEAGHIDAISTVLGRTTTTNGDKNGYGTINHNGGTLCTVTLTLTDQLGDATTATYNLAGGVLEATTIEQGQSGSGTITFDWTGGTIANKTGTDLTISSDVTLTTTGAGGQSFDADSGQTITLNGQLTGTGGFATSDAGTVNITNATNDSTGQTDVNAGVLAGIGTVNNLYINAGGTVDPGAPGVVGTLSVVNGVTQNGGDLHIDVDGGTSDLLDVTGTITLNDDVIFDVINAPTAITIPIMENDGTGDPVSSVFTGLPEGAGVTLGGISYVISYAGDDGNDIVLTKDAIPVVTNNDPAVTFTEAGAPVTIAPNLSVTDAENQITAASVSIDNFVAGEDMLAINGTLPAGITADLSVPGTITLTGAATPADYQAALQLITYQNTDTQSPSTAPRSITISVTDGAGLTASAAQTVNVIDTAEPTAPGTGTTDPLGELNLNGGSGIFQGFRFSLYNRDPDERQGEEFDETLPDVLLTLTPFYSGTTSPDARVTIRVIGPGGEVLAGGTQTVTAGRSGFFAASFPGLELDRNTAYVVVIEESIPDGDGNFHRGPARALFAPSINSQEITRLQDLIDFQSELNVMERELLRNLYPNGIIGLDLGIEIKP